MEHPYTDTLVASGNLDLESFSDEINRLLKLSWGEDWGEFQLEEPTGNDPEEIKLPIITYDFLERVRSKSHPSLDPVHFDTFVDEENEQLVKVYRSWFDVEFIFSTYHTSNREALQISSDLEAFLFTYKSHLKRLGLSEIIFQKELRPSVKTKWSKQVVQRQLLYLVRIERITQVRSDVIKDITMRDTDVVPTSPLFGGSKMLGHYLEQQKIKP